MQVINQVLLQMTDSLIDKYSSNDTAKGIDNFFLKHRPVSWALDSYSNFDSDLSQELPPP